MPWILSILMLLTVSRSYFPLQWILSSNIFDIFSGEAKGSVVWRLLHKLCIIRHFGRGTNFLSVLCLFCVYRETQSLGLSIWHLSWALNLLQIFLCSCKQKSAIKPLWTGVKTFKEVHPLFPSLRIPLHWILVSTFCWLLNSLRLCLCVYLVISLYFERFGNVILL